MPPHPATDSLTTCSKCGFLRASVLLDVAAEPQLACLFVAADSRHDWAEVVGQNLIVTDKGFWSWARQKLL
jgi:hypothetical protein